VVHIIMNGESIDMGVKRAMLERSRRAAVGCRRV
jgi:hypothetical protein